jgi:hypothetical protein
MSHEPPRGSGEGPVLVRALEYAQNLPGNGPVLAKMMEAADKDPGPGPALVKMFRMGQPVADKRIYKKGGLVKSSASSRGDGAAKRGKTRGKIL